MISLDGLPIELLYCIFDRLDAETILTSIRYVCKRLYLLTDTYNRYEFNFKGIYKHKFHQLCRIIHPENVISLMLANNNQTPQQIESFLACCHIEQYNRLQSVTLVSIEDSHLKLFIEHLLKLKFSFIQSLVIHCDINSNLTMETLQLLSTIIGSQTLRKLDLSLGQTVLEQLPWPNQSSIHFLKLSDAIDLRKFCTILRYSPYLRTMIMPDCLIYDNHECQSFISNTCPFRQLTSLTLEDVESDLVTIESFLSLTPSLIYFKIKSYMSELFDGNRWEQLIERKLPHLIDIQFAFQSNAIVSNDLTGLQKLIALFQTPFWLEKKQWFVTALCNKNSPVINLYTIQDCAPKISFGPKANKIICSTAPHTIENVITMDNVRELTLNLNEMQADKDEIETRRLFNRLTKLNLQFHDEWPVNSIEFLSSLIDLSTIIDLELDCDAIQIQNEYLSNLITGIHTLLAQTNNIQSLIISTRLIPIGMMYSIIRTHPIRHFEVPVQTIDDIKMVLSDTYNLSSLTFRFPRRILIPIEDILACAAETHSDFRYHSNYQSISLWLGTKYREKKKNFFK